MTYIHTYHHTVIDMYAVVVAEHTYVYTQLNLMIFKKVNKE